jgi:D-xylose reductase
MRYQTLRSGRDLPMVGLGLWKIEPENTSDAVVAAVEAGYRHFDSACDYGNESEAGEGLRRAMAAAKSRGQSSL